MLAALAFLVAAAPVVDPAAQLRAEAARLRGMLSAFGPDDPERAYVQEPLDKAEAALAAGRLLFAASRLREAGQNAEGRVFASARVSVQEAGLPAFEEEWRRLGNELQAMRAALPADLGARSPIAVRALVEASLATVEPLHTSGRLYGENTTVEYGLYYLGMGRSAIPWAGLLGSLVWSAPPQPPLTSPDSALEALDAEILDAYAKATTGEARQAFIGSNTALKRARDLRRDGRLFGTWLELLQARRALGLARRLAGLLPEPTPGDRERIATALRERVASWSDGLDHSLGRLFVEEAEVALEAGDLRRGAAIVEDVLPAYAAASAGPRATLAQLQAPPPGAVTVTLVRWP